MNAGWGISPLKSTRFHPEIWWILPVKSGRFHPDFTCEIHPNYKSKCFSKNSSVWWMKGGGYDQGFHEIHPEIWWISPRFHLWNPPKIIKASVSAKTLQFDECRVGAMTKDFMKSAGFHMKSTWNPLDFKIMRFCMMIKYRSFVFQKTNQKSFCWNIWFYKVWGGFHLKSTRFHEIWQISCEIKRPLARNCNPMIGLSIERPILDHHPKAHIHEIWWISWNLADFTMKSGGFHHEIWQISPWNLVDFTMKSMKSSGFHHEIQQISWNPWNPVDFTMKSGGFHEIRQISGEIRCFRNQMQMFQQKLFWLVFRKSKDLYLIIIQKLTFNEIWQISYGFHEIWWILYGFHEIQWISWNLADFIWISWNLADFIWISPWNLVDFTMKSSGFHEIHEIWQISSEIQWISPRYHLWNPPKIIKASVSAKTLQFDECRVGDFTLEIWWISPWNLVDFNHEIWWISPRFHLWNPPKIIKASVSAKTLQFDECRVGAMTKDFMKSTRFHPEIWWISPVKSSRVHPDFIYEIHPKL